MRLSLDPGCREARRLGAEHRRADSLLLQGLESSRLAEILDEQRDASFCAHLVACERCQRFVRTCASCDVDLAERGHKFTCSKNQDRWRGLLASGEPPLAHLGQTVQVEVKVPVRSTPAPARPAQRSGPASGLARSASADARPTPAARPAAAARSHAQPRPAKPAPRPKSAWEILGLHPGASPSRIREAYHERALMYHPDRVEHMAPEFRQLAEERMREINAAYQSLSRR